MNPTVALFPSRLPFWPAQVEYLPGQPHPTMFQQPNGYSDVQNYVIDCDEFEDGDGIKAVAGTLMTSQEGSEYNDETSC